jgi:ribonucleoside-diphosphate reductase alpha chain
MGDTYMSMANKVTQIRKRDGRIESFQPEKISNAISKALKATGTQNGEAAGKLAQEVIELINIRYTGQLPRVEDVQDIVEQVLMKAGYTEVAKAYILYRQQRTIAREAKRLIGVTDDLKLGVNAVNVLKHRYLQRDEKGNVVETPSQLFRRVAHAVSACDALYGTTKEEVCRIEEEFYQLMANRTFMPNSPTLMNAGTDIGQLAACFVLPIEDSMESIFETLKHMALIHKSGGGTGFSFSRIRPKGDLVKSTMGVASGPVSFMGIYDQATGIIKQGGRRRGANMGILRVDHPDILEFITSKSRTGTLENFNISVAVTDDFMQAVNKDEEYALINPRNKEIVRRLHAREVFELITVSAWQTGDPGLMFLDRINKRNPTPGLGEIESTNPCGEVPLLPYESCILGSINLAQIVANGRIDWEKLKALTHSGIHFLDNVITANVFPLPQIKAATEQTRKVGLGVMGLADMLIQLGVSYASNEALDIGEQVIGCIFEEACKMSQILAGKRGAFTTFIGSVWDRPGAPVMRNATVTSIAPAGSISIIADTSSGIEPLFAVAFVREVMEGARLVEVNPYFEKIAKDRGFYSKELMTEVAKRGSVQSIDAVPPDIRSLFVTALDIDPEWHVKMQAAFQHHVDNAVAKTVNLPGDATPTDVWKIYMLAYNLGCKGITVYRYGSKPVQVLYIGNEQGKDNLVVADSGYAGGCPAGVCTE